MSWSIDCSPPSGGPPDAQPLSVVVDYVGYTWGVSVRLLQRPLPGVAQQQGRHVQKPLVVDSSWTLWADFYAASGVPKLSRIALINYVAATGRATLIVPMSVTSQLTPGKVGDSTFPVHVMLGYTDGSAEDFVFGKLSFLALDPASAEILP